MTLAPVKSAQHKTNCFISYIENPTSADNFFILINPMRDTYSGIFSLILLLTLSAATRAQDVYEPTLTSDESPIALVVQNRNNRAKLFLTTGQTLHAKVMDSKAYENGTIISITDTTITIQDKGGDPRVIPVKSLSLIKIPRSMERKLASVLVLGVAVGFAVGSIQFISEVQPGDGSSGPGVATSAIIITADILAVAAPIAVGIGAVAIFKARKFHIGRWKINSTRAVVPGNKIRVVRKNGEVIDKLQVTLIKGGHIIGFQQWSDSAGRLVSRNRRISFVDVSECSRER